MGIKRTWIEKNEYNEDVECKEHDSGHVTKELKMTPAQLVIMNTPPNQKQLTRYEFRSLFTFDEQVAITMAAKADVVVEVFMKSMEVAEVINLDYPETAQGLGYLVGLGLIKQEKMDNILKGF